MSRSEGYDFLDEGLRISGCPGGSVVKILPPSAGDVGSIPGSGRSPGGHGNPLQYFARIILKTEEPGGLQYMELRTVGHN